MLYAVAGHGCVDGRMAPLHGENQRLARNQEALASEIALYRTQAGEEAASAQVLRLALRRIRTAAGRRCRRDPTAGHPPPSTRSLGPDRHRVDARNPHPAAGLAHRAARHLRDPLPKLRDAARHAALLPLERPLGPHRGDHRRDSVHCRIHSVDTLRQIVHRIPHRFLFIRWGTKALRQEIVSQNPHTRIVYTEYIRIER